LEKLGEGDKDINDEGAVVLWRSLSQFLEVGGDDLGCLGFYVGLYHLWVLAVGLSNLANDTHVKVSMLICTLVVRQANGNKQGIQD